MTIELETKKEENEKKNKLCVRANQHVHHIVELCVCSEVADQHAGAAQIVLLVSLYSNNNGGQREIKKKKKKWKKIRNLQIA